jgi:hypothetical protein
MIDADYTFLNRRLAEHYGIDCVSGPHFRRVLIPADSPREPVNIAEEGSLFLLWFALATFL